MPTTTVIDTIHHVIYDTVHTSVFDTVHTVTFDTVRVVLDSSFTPQVLRDSQAFYSWAFMAIVAIIGLGSGILAFVLNRLWDKKVDVAVDKLKQDFAQIAEEKAKDVSSIAANEAASLAAEKSKEEFEKLIGKQKEDLKSLKDESSRLWMQQVMDDFLLIRIEKDAVTAATKMIRLMDKIMLKPDEATAKFVKNLFLPELKKTVYSIQFAEGYDSLAIMVIDGLNNIKSSIAFSNLEKKFTIDICKSIDEVVFEMNKRFDEFRKIKRGESTSKPGRFQVP